MEKEIKWYVLYHNGANWMRTVFFDTERQAQAHAKQYLLPIKLDPPFEKQSPDRSHIKYVTVRSEEMPPKV